MREGVGEEGKRYGIPRIQWFWDNVSMVCKTASNKLADCSFVLYVFPEMCVSPLARHRGPARACLLLPYSLRSTQLTLRSSCARALSSGVLTLPSVLFGLIVLVRYLLRSHPVEGFYRSALCGEL